MDWAKLYKELNKHGPDLLRFAGYFFLLRTRQLMILSQGKRFGDRIWPGMLFLVVAFLLSLGLAIFIVGEMPSVPALASQFLWRIVAGVCAWAPLFLLLYFLKRDGIALLINIMCFLQVPAVLVFGLASAEYALPQPARTDFSKFAKGVGQGTAVYDFECGSLESIAQLLVYGRGIEEASVTVQQAQKAFENGTAHYDKVMDAYDEQIRVMSINVPGQMQQLRKMERLEADYNATYPNVLISQNIFSWGTTFFGGYGLLNILLLLLLDIKSWPRRAIALSAFAVTFLAMALCGYVVNQMIAYPDPIEFDVIDPDTGEPLDYLTASNLAGDPATLKKYERAVADFNARRPRREGRARAMFIEAKERCPDAKNFGLW